MWWYYELGIDNSKTFIAFHRCIVMTIQISPINWEQMRLFSLLAGAHWANTIGFMISKSIPFINQDLKLLKKAKKAFEQA